MGATSEPPCVVPDVVTAGGAAIGEGAGVEGSGVARGVCVAADEGVGVGARGEAVATAGGEAVAGGGDEDVATADGGAVVGTSVPKAPVSSITAT